ncbi:T9SS type B sorting domain-containing protein [Flavivirga spongiicola]|uniref:T9SS type B sorting domain-containing protein n=1 Tax=Flavivirga spongiicola TaxID=421621 RepID=A0ABU7XYZ4_9FLAO|nr:T9SS type B sorting domain-containing protein [Flavivirga sp. MEBiC05379]MDO5980792.1 T9SS type B sorting domain-containing protein [Flavivirga sp. MEBiC05379]
MILSKRHISKYLFAFFYISMVLTAKAQLKAHLIDGEGWIKGNYIEIGINSKGVYGAQLAKKPTLFHDNRDVDKSGLFGFIANPQKDGWIDYDGDFFVPGKPEEGFAIEINGVNYNNNNFEGLYDISGRATGATILSSDCFEDVAQITWEGNIDGLNIKRYYRVTQDGLFIQMRTSIKNVSEVTKKNLFFMHNVDPDNNKSLSGTYNTDIKLAFQASSITDNICLVTASQKALGTPKDKDGSHVSLYAKDSRARVTYGGFANRSASGVWNGSGFTYREGSNTDDIDEAISIAFNLGDISAGKTIYFVYYYVLENIEENFTPFIVDITQENPSSCDGNDGKFLISGLNSNSSYLVNYRDDGILIPEKTYISDNNGTIEILNLNSGIYTDFEIKYKTCSSIPVETIFELSDPPAPTYSFIKKDLTRCDSFEGIISITGLMPNATYHVSYTDDDTSIAKAAHTTDSSGNINLTGLDKGIYKDFVVEINNCETASNAIIELVQPDPPNFNLTKQDILSCKDPDGKITLSGLIANTSYNLSYFYNDNEIEKTLYTSNDDGKIMLSKLSSGVYKDFTLEVFNCSAFNSSNITLLNPEVLITPVHQFYCDDDYDYMTTIDLSKLDTDILQGRDSNLFKVTYHKTEEAIINNVSIPKSNYTTQGTHSYNIYAKITNSKTGCYNYAAFTITVNIPPDFELTEDFICLNSDDTPNIVDYNLPVIKTPFSELDYDFQWYYNDHLLTKEITSQLIVIDYGEHTVKITNKSTGCHTTKSTYIYPSGPPQELEVKITTSPFSENHNIEIRANGFGDYVFGIDDKEPQSSPIFLNITPGYHRFRIIDLNGCGEVIVSKIAIDYMKYFTPNNDGFNDRWQIIGVEALIKPEIFIFDRYGKLIKNLNPLNPRWDGTINGKKLPSGDYWFVIEFEDDTTGKNVFKSHFTLKR